MFQRLIQSAAEPALRVFGETGICFPGHSTLVRRPHATVSPIDAGKSSFAICHDLFRVVEAELVDRPAPPHRRWRVPTLFLMMKSSCSRLVERRVLTSIGDSAACDEAARANE